MGYKSEHYLRHKNRAKYIENFHLCKEQAGIQSKKKDRKRTKGRKY